jgi:uncharacterized protein YxeA
MTLTQIALLIYFVLLLVLVLAIYFITKQKNRYRDEYVEISISYAKTRVKEDEAVKLLNEEVAKRTIRKGDTVVAKFNGVPKTGKVTDVKYQIEGCGKKLYNISELQ